MLTLIAVAAVIVSGEPGLPDLRVSGAGLNLSETPDARAFANRVADQTHAYCAVNLDRLMPEHLAHPKVCERAMADLVVAALPDARRRDFRNAGGRRELVRLQR